MKIDKKYYSKVTSLRVKHEQFSTGLRDKSEIDYKYHEKIGNVSSNTKSVQNMIKYAKKLKKCAKYEKKCV